MQDWNAHARGIDAIRFADGGTWNRQDIYLRIGLDYLGRDYESDSLAVDGETIWSYFIDEFGNLGNIIGEHTPGPHNIYIGYEDYNEFFVGTSGHNTLAGEDGNDISRPRSAEATRSWSVCRWMPRPGRARPETSWLIGRVTRRARSLSVRTSTAFAT